ncbi:MAG: SpoIIE family protein phosphatase [Deltaproteobacteria bacterium]|nr:SpoIIE family protein phosphatase [Deltaproteobacteria bacterium]
MLRNVKIGTKILVVMLATALGALLVIATISYKEMLNLTKYSQEANVGLGLTASDKSRQALLDQAEAYLLKIVAEQAGNSNAALAQVQTEVSAMADYMEALYADPDNFRGHELPLPNKTEKGVASSKYILAPNVKRTAALEKELKLVSNAEYMFKAVLGTDSTLDNTYLGTQSGISYRYSRSNSYSPDFDPRARGWYIAALAREGETVWTDTYLDVYGILCVTCAATYIGQDGSPAGVVASDITLTKLKEDVLATKIGKGGYAFLLDKTGKYIAHPNYDKKGFETHPLSHARGAWLDTIQAMMAGKSGVQIATVDGLECYVAYAKLPSTGWSLGITVPIAEVTLPAVETKATIGAFTNKSQLYIRDTLSNVLMRFIILFAVCTMLFVVLSFVLASTITRPIKRLVERVRYMGHGNLDSKIEVRGHDEVGELSEAFNTMAGDLQVYISNLSAAIGEKERINSELQVASNIQNDMLPRIFPTFSDLFCLKVNALMTPAKVVGGDFYDCFFLNEAKTRFCMVIADVSGKGVPASLFMVIAKTLIKTHMLSCKTPAEAIRKVNNLLCEDNGSCMFVTAFIGVIDTETGLFDYVNCGHNPPLLFRSGTGFSYMEINPSCPLAAMEDAEYIDETTQLTPGDSIYMYTDGVTEAMNEEGALFGEEALHAVLNAASVNLPDELDRVVRDAVKEHVGAAEQSDDITTLVVQYTRKGSSR